MIHPGTEGLSWVGRDAAPALPLAEAVALSVHDDLAEIEAVWRGFETGAVRSIYQRFDWVNAWVRRAGVGQRVTPAIVVGRLRGETAFILPLGRRRSGPLRVVSWLGGSHVNINCGLYHPDFLRFLSPSDVPSLVRRLGAALRPVDFLDLPNQPRSWEGFANPLAAMPGTVDAQPVLAMRLDRDFRVVAARGNPARRRKKLRWQENALAPMGGYRVRRARTAAEAHEILSVFLAQKAIQFARAGMQNVFAEAGVAAFLGELADGVGQDGLIDFRALEIAGSIRATFASGIDRGRVYGYFSSIAQDEFTRVSPGELLLTSLIRESCEAGLTALDLGIGEERYKTAWATEPEPHFSLFLPVTPLGRLAVGSVAAWKGLEYRVRQSRSLWQMVKRVRRATATTVPPPAEG